MTKLWKAVTGPSAGLVQQHFVKSRLDDLKRRNPGLEEKVIKALSEYPAFAGMKLAENDRWLDVYRKINENLKKAELTINFEPASWFTTENKYETYAQTYERGFNAEKANILRDDKFGTGAVRARVDDAVTLPPGMAHQRQMQRGLTPGVRAGQDIDNRMRFGGHQAVSSDAKHDMDGVKSMNPRFDAKTKQVFAALNYARRPNGSSTLYGPAFLVLSERLKANAIYFAADTFLVDAIAGMDKKPPSSAQIAYGMLAAVVGTAHHTMLKELINACYFNTPAGNTDQMFTLLEAHLFEEVRFSTSLQAVCLPLSYRGSVIEANARTFCKKHGAKLQWIY